MQDNRPASPNAWYVRNSRLESGIWLATGYLGGEHGDGDLVDASTVDPDRPWLWRLSESPRGIVRVDISPRAIAGSPPLWFVNVDEPRHSPAATNLVAYSTDHFPPGTVISGYQYATLGIRNEEQVGAVRWYPQLALVHQIFVGEKWRRMQVGTVLIYAAAAFHRAKGWDGRLHSDGRRTEDGERFVASLTHQSRVAPLDEKMSSMDPTQPASD